VGVETCRSIEFARCEAAESCKLIEDADSCRRFARDHCLHGNATEKPSPTQVNRCTAAIEALGRCAKENGRKSSLLECPEAQNVGDEAENVCELVLEPELARRCQFLVPPEPEPEPPRDAGND
jgi:hypothetical protein